jgi:hypothetical protein
MIASDAVTAVDADGAISERHVIAVYAALSALALAPVLVFSTPNFTDHPNHLARLSVLVGTPDGPLAHVYEPTWALIPNVAVDAIALLLQPWIAPATVLQGAMAMALAGILLAVAGLHRHLFGALTPIVWLACLPVFNVATSMGYVNYLLGSAVALGGAHLWLAWARKPLWIQALAFNAIGCVLFFCHVGALVFFGLTVAAFELFPPDPRHRHDLHHVFRVATKGLAGFALPLALVALAERPDHLGVVSYAEKARMLIAPTYVVPFGAFVLTFVTLTLVLYELARSKRLLVAPALRPALIALGLVTLALPSRISFAVDVDARLFVSVVFLAIAALRIDRPTPRRVTVLAATLFVVVAGRSAWIATEWRDWSQELAGFRSAIEVVEPGAALLVAGWSLEAPERQCPTARTEPSHVFWHVPSYAVVDRGAFVPTVFTGRGMQPIRAAAAYRHLDTPASTPIPHDLLLRAARPAEAESIRRSLEAEAGPGYFIGWPRAFDYVVFLHYGCSPKTAFEHLVPITVGSFYTLYRVTPGSGRQ